MHAEPTADFPSVEMELLMLESNATVDVETQPTEPAEDANFQFVETVLLTELLVSNVMTTTTFLETDVLETAPSNVETDVLRVTRSVTTDLSTLTYLLVILVPAVLLADSKDAVTVLLTLLLVKPVMEPLTAELTAH